VLSRHCLGRQIDRATKVNCKNSFVCTNISFENIFLLQFTTPSANAAAIGR
jgi:hypothetical protein